MAQIKKTDDRFNPQTLRNDLRAFRMQFEALRQTGMQADPDGISMLVDKIEAFEELAFEMGNEISAFRWNYQGQTDLALAAETRALMQAANDENSNILFLPFADRPFGDGQ